MTTNMINACYTFDDNNNIWMRPEYEGIAYSDGSEIEQHLKSIIDASNDIGVMSVELANHCTDWPTTYHLSRKRSNIFRPFKELLAGKTVLEIGAGCGAISRYLGESGANVTALEGSPMRASIGASRCRDLDNVTVISDNFQSFETEQKFDFVTLIGVLEYARSFVSGDDPIANMLIKAQNYLKPNGILVIAIENQLGLKYFAGYPEDHLGKPMIGIEEHYGETTAVTFGKKDLGERVASAGLTEQQWWYPFPDYKMPSLMVTEKGADSSDDFDLATLVRGACFSDRQTPQGVSFIQERAWLPVIKNGLLGDMANSFVLLASKNQVFEKTSHYAFHYATERRPEYSKQVVFEAGAAGEVLAHQRALYPEALSQTDKVTLALDNQAYVIGDSWQDELVKIMTSPNWSVAQISDWLTTWWVSLQAYSSDLDVPLALDGEVNEASFIDAMPRNLFHEGNTSFKFIDLEWHYHEKVTVRFIWFRALLSSFQSMGICALPCDGTPLHLKDLIRAVLVENKLELNDSELHQFIEQEAKFQLLTGGRQGLRLSDYQKMTIRTFDTLTPAFEKIRTIEDAHHHEVVRYEAELAHSTEAINNIYQSTSWKLTRPVRLARKLLGKLKRGAIRAVILGKTALWLLSKLIKESGGLGSVLAKTVSLYRREGFASVKRVIMFSMLRKERNNYDQWVKSYGVMTNDQRAVICDNIEKLGHQPLISVVMPSYNPNPTWLMEAIESVQSQLYIHWELCIADDLSSDPDVRSVLEKFAQADSRIKIVFRKENGHISAASNSAIELASGDWVALMDHDDLLSEDALYWVADAINNNPNTRLIYSDEDKMNEQGLNERHSPYFKCDWNKDLFYSHNMFSHLGVFDKKLIDSVDGFRVGLEGSQDYDLVLRCLEKIEESQIYHIPRVLYHWRVHKESTAGSGDAKPYAVIAGERALNEHFERINIDAKATFDTFGFRVKYALLPEQPLVSLVIPTRNGLDITKQCIDSVIEKTTYSNYEIIVMDNGSDDPKILEYFELLKSQERIQVVRDERPFNYSQLNNAAVELSKGELVCLLNNDIEVISPEWLSEMVSHALRPDVGVVGAKLWYPNDTLQHGGVVLGLGGVAGHSHKHFPKGSPGYLSRMGVISSFSALTAACLLIKKSIYEEVGGLNEKELKVAFNDVDFCLRVKEAGYRNVWTPYAELYHHESITRGDDDTSEKQARFASEVSYMEEKWKDYIAADPAYSPNLSLKYDDFSLAWPPRV